MRLLKPINTAIRIYNQKLKKEILYHHNNDKFLKLLQRLKETATIEINHSIYDTLKIH